MFIFNQKSLRVIFLSCFIMFSTVAVQANIDASFLKQMRILSESRGMVWKAYKAYLMIGSKNNYKDPKKMLDSSVASFESAIKSTESYAKKHKLTKMMPIMKDVDSQWSELKKILLATPSKEQVNTIDTKAMKITRTIIKALKTMGSYDKSGEWKYLEQTQKAQNIAERMATLYIANSWNAIDPKRYDKMMNKAVTNYEKVVKLIKSSKYYTPQIASELEHSNKDFIYFKMMWKAKNNIYIPTLIYQKSSDMAEHMEKCTDLIVKELAKR